MKFRQIGRATLASVLSLAIGLGITACSTDYTIAYLYVTAQNKGTTASTNGLISAYKIDNQSGTLEQMDGSPFGSGGRDPVAEVVSPNGLFLYVINQIDSSVVEFAIGTDGKLYPQNTYTLGAASTGGTIPTSVAIDPQSKFLYVAFTYRPGFTPASPGPGGVTVFPINSDYSLGTPVANGSLQYFPAGNNPVSIFASPLNNFLYLVDQGDASVVGYSIGSNGALTLLSGCKTTAGVPTCFQAGVSPSAINEELTSRFVYVTDRASNQFIGYDVATNGNLTPMTNSPFGTDNYPVAILTDPRAKYLYIANYNSSTIRSYALDPATGAPSGVSGAGSVAVATGPNFITIEPSLGIYVYTSNFLDNSVSGMQMDPHNGTLVQIQNTPFGTSANPTCVASAAAGSHATQYIQP